MADIFSEHVSKYGAFLYGGPNGNNQATATVWLRFEGRPEFVWLRFYPPGYQLPESYEVEHSAGYSMYYVSYRSGDYSKVIDLLRNEDPIHFYWNSETGAVYLRCGAEEVGEGEGEDDDDDD
ncbi:MAG: hypothetical protein GY711_18775 [bacterium]|nr:hypothetical protein [bacterium]